MVSLILFGLRNIDKYCDGGCSSCDLRNTIDENKLLGIDRVGCVTDLSRIFRNGETKPLEKFVENNFRKLKHARFDNSNYYQLHYFKLMRVRTIVVSEYKHEIISDAIQGKHSVWSVFLGLIDLAIEKRLSLAAMIPIIKYLGGIGPVV